MQPAYKDRESRKTLLPTPYFLLPILLVLALFAAGCAAGFGGESGSIARNFDLSERQFSERGGGATAELAVGSKDFTEQEILSHITLQALRAADAEVVDRTGLGDTEEVRQALATGEIDMYWEYTGTGWLIHLAKANPIPDPREQYRAVAEEDLQENSIVWLDPAPANNTYAIAVNPETAERLNVQTISDLGRLIEENPEEATICVGPEFGERADGLPGLEERYGFQFPDANVFVLPDSTVYGAVAEGEKCNFGSVFNTSGRVPALDLRLLEDDEGFFAAYNPSLTMREETLQQYPELEALFAPISERLDTQTLRELSAAVEVEGESPEAVAERWLQENGFIG